MSYKTNMAAMNAARKEFGKNWKSKATIEKLDGEWHIQLIALEAEVSQAQIDAEFEAAKQAADAQANAEQAASTLPNGKIWIHVSSIAKPTKVVWTIADAMIAEALAAGAPLPSRKQVQDECVRRGIASGTARTQYQAWKKANDDAALNAAHAAELSKKFNGGK